MAVRLAHYHRRMAIGRALHRGFCLDPGRDAAFFASAIIRRAATLRLPRHPAADVDAGRVFDAGEHSDCGNIAILAVAGVAGAGTAPSIPTTA